MSKAPICDHCGIQMIERTRRIDGQKFYGCQNWPKCNETARHEDTDSEEDEDEADMYGNRSYYDTLI